MDLYWLVFPYALLFVMLACIENMTCTNSKNTDQKHDMPFFQNVPILSLIHSSISPKKAQIQTNTSTNAYLCTYHCFQYLLQYIPIRHG